MAAPVAPHRRRSVRRSSVALVGPLVGTASRPWRGSSPAARDRADHRRRRRRRPARRRHACTASPTSTPTPTTSSTASRSARCRAPAASCWPRRDRQRRALRRDGVRRDRGARPRAHPASGAGRAAVPRDDEPGAAAEIAAIEPDAVVAKGDLTADGTRDEYAAVPRVLRAAFGERLHHVRGNHDAYYGETFAATSRPWRSSCPACGWRCSTPSSPSTPPAR